MNHFLYLFSIYLLSFRSHALPLQENNYEDTFNLFILKYNRTYQYGSSEYKMRYSNFLASIKRVSYQNKLTLIQTGGKNGTTVYGITKFSDLSPKEFREMYLSTNVDWKSEQNGTFLFGQVRHSSLANTWDWRTKGIVTAVKDQGACGSCWAFSSVENVESSWALQGNTKIVLSTQEVVDCSNNNYGCKGGSPCNALSWIKTNQIKLERDSLYPYKGVTEKCLKNSKSTGIGISDYYCYWCHGACPGVEVKKMLPLVQRVGPMAISVNAVSWQDYVSGVIQHHCSHDSANHAVQIVGFNMNEQPPYWIVRNSWGSGFGENGYLRIKIGENVCGVANAYNGVKSTFGS